MLLVLFLGQAGSMALDALSCKSMKDVMLGFSIIINVVSDQPLWDPDGLLV